MIGIGTDLVHIPRIQKLFERFGTKFINRILSENEKKLFFKVNDPAFLAKRFAGKEAVAKALGTGIGKHLAFNEISIENQSNGKPFVELLYHAKSYVASQGVNEILISLSDEGEYALAFVIVK